MNNSEMRERLISIYNCLNNIEVKGQVSVTNLAACLQIITDIINAPSIEPDTNCIA